MAGINALVDPFLVIGAPRIAGLNALKPQTDTRTALAKTYAIERLQPEGVLIGSSKVDVGLDPDDPNLPADARPAFNYGIPGSGFADNLRQLQEAAATGRLRFALVALEFEDFLPHARAPAARLPDPEWAEEDRRYLVAADGRPNPHRVWQHARDIFLATLSLDATLASLRTVAAQSLPGIALMTAHGMRGEDAFCAAVAREGSASLFAQKDLQSAPAFLRHEADTAATAATAAPAAAPDLQPVRDLIAFCRRYRIRLVLVILPAHADWLESVRRAGLWERFEAWKVALARLAWDAGRVPLWDYRGYDPYSTEAVPGAGAHWAMRWAWDPNHFKQALGRRVLAQVLGGAAGPGVRLTPDDVAARNRAVREAGQAYRRAHPEAVRRVEDAFARAHSDER